MALSRIQTAEIADNAVTTVKVDDATVIETDIVDGTITNTMVAAGAAIAHTKCAVGPVAVLDVGTTANKILQLDGSGNLPALDGTQLTGITTDFTPLENQMSRLGLHIGAVGQLAKFNMIDQVIDDYEDATGVVAYNAAAAIPAVGAYQDAGGSGHTITQNGTATISTTQKKFGTHSLKFDGGSNSGHYSIPDSTDWDVQTSGANPHASPNGSYTVEFWMYQTAWPSTYCHIIGMATQTFNWSIYQNAANKRMIVGWIGNWAIDWADNKLVLNQWQHIAIVKDVANTYCYIDGVEAGLHGSSAARTANVWSYNSTGTGTGGMRIGGGGLWSAFPTVNGYLDEIRISNVARYTANFTPPTAAFTSDANTVLLIHGEAQSAAPAVPNTGSSSSATRAGSTGAKYYSGSSNSNQILLSTTTTAASAVTKADILVQTEDSTGTATINTDVKVGVSRDALNYIPATLAKISTWGSGNVYAANDVTVGPGLVMTKDVTVAAAETILFAYTGADVNWTVPPGVATATIIAWGAGGGGGSVNGFGGGGGYISGDISVTAGETLVVKVGGKGVHNTPSPLTGVGQGGGGTGIYRSGTVLAIAGAGGGSASSHYGGAGGGTTGGDGAGTYKGLGGTQSAGGAGGAAAGGRPAGNAGSLNQGGHGVLGGIATTNPAAYNGGGQGGGDLTNYTTTGGGGGYYGGGSGGSGANGSGGGGSSLTAGTNTQATTYTPAQTGHANYPGGNVGYGGAAGVDGVAGYMVIKTIVPTSKYVIDGAQDTLTLTEGYTYKFDTSDSTNATHHFKFSTTADGTHGSGVDYTTGVTYNGTSGSAGAYTQIVVAASAPTLYYWCHHHASMGGQANTPAEASTTSMRYRIDTKNQSYTATPQGYAGGDTTGTESGGAGGGGAGAVGVTVTGTSISGDGGDGLTSSIDGTPTPRAGGGGGGKHYTNAPDAGDGGLGGGGNGATNSAYATAGAVNTGSGGGGANHPGLSTGNPAGLGGSGIVIIRTLTSNASGVTGNWNDTNTDGSYTWWKWTTVTSTGTFTTPTPASYEYLVIAGGGAGGAHEYGGGGGAGGYRTATDFPVSGTISGITVGAGGALPGAYPNNDGGNGGDSVFSSITSLGGGGGAGGGSSASADAQNGGSGGGAARSTSGNGGTAGPVAVSGKVTRVHGTSLAWK